MYPRSPILINLPKVYFIPVAAAIAFGCGNMCGRLTAKAVGILRTILRTNPTSVMNLLIIFVNKPFGLATHGFGKKAYVVNRQLPPALAASIKSWNVIQSSALP